MNAFRLGISMRNAFMCHPYCGLGSKRTESTIAGPGGRTFKTSKGAPR